MTNQGDPSGPSLFQARGTRHDHDHHHHHHHNHNHNHNHQHLHLHQHRRLQSAEVDPTSTYIRSPPSEKLHGRHVVVVQTVSVVQFIDATGAVTSVETLTPDPVESSNPVFPAAVTSFSSEVGDALPSVSLTDLLPDLTDGAPSKTSSSLLASSETLTSTPLTTSSAFPTLSVTSNSSSTHVSSLFGNHTTNLYSNSSRTSSALRSVFASTTTRSSSSLWTSTTSVTAATIEVGEAGADSNTGGESSVAAPAPTDPTSESHSSGLAPETRNAVVGGVVGSVAGIALIVIALLFLLKWRKRRGQGIMLLGDGDNNARGRGFSSPEPASPSGGKSMVQRAGAFSIPSALARLSGKRAIEEPSAGPSPQEKGFYRVSGRKLISVLESGGDGYSDPHDSNGSGSSHYRDSQGGLLDSSNPFQLGSPMRPVSGVPIFRDGAQRTPVHEQGPLRPGHRPSVFPRTSSTSDSPGRGFAFRDGSRGSGFRFTEDA
ncbi:hypothetical protein MYCTH_2314597 [Thermothelomyces thermophilus ATCC 42464]|uniref:Mid2 domain-containing protein n=1 Tax=Thermothelomyces thermophilus (strain ATCC 42464 / BCRC 31852 / DSM 1799) TaxID=573729 RepID=G2Q947_THET4|nr:uncharacterized protein MYCTH_2314597 [Thermothelomyces thermophilus ATCC 42464]AEO56339.1 hypothetical protein MYCTH_2314597 [Thermothelomyces thermophilus ATCC 42464]